MHSGERNTQRPTPVKQAAGLELRAACAEALVRIRRDGLKAPLALDRFVYSAPDPGDERDRALAKELVMGVLRWGGTLTALLRAMGRKPRLPFRDDWSLMVMQCGMYQVLFTQKVPDYAAAHSTVELLKNHSGKAVAGFANALLRKCAAAEGLEGLIDRAAPGRREEVLLASYPAWLVRRLRKVYGNEEALALAMAMHRRPAVFVRVDGMDAAQAGREIRRRLPNAEVEAGRWFPACLKVEKGGDLKGLDLYKKGKITVQDEGSQLAASALAAGGSDRVLDVCCGVGIKTGQISRMLGSGSILAMDKNTRKIRMLRSEARRLGLSALKIAAADAAHFPLKAGALFDRILVDAPCSGTGTLARRPEIRFRLRKSDPKRLAALQENILSSAACHLDKGGVLLYSVCSILPEEGPEVVRACLKKNPDLRLIEPPGLPRTLTTGGSGGALLLPTTHGTEGFFIAAMTR